MSDQRDRTNLNPSVVLRRVAFGFVLVSLVIVVSVSVIDRPVARFMATHVHDRVPFIAIAALANLPSPLATLTLIAAAVACWSGISLNRLSRLAVAAALATLVAITIKNQLKFDFGRVWPQSNPFPGISNHPSFLADHVYGFYPFHGGSSYASFPSGHTTAITAPMSVLWSLQPRLRVLWAGVIILVVVGLIAADFHFVSDTIAGFALGSAVAAATVTLLSRWVERGITPS